MESEKNRKGPAIKTAVFMLFLITAIVAIRFTPLRGYFTAERLEMFLEAAGLVKRPVGRTAFLEGTFLACALHLLIFHPQNSGEIQSLSRGCCGYIVVLLQGIA